LLISRHFFDPCAAPYPAAHRVLSCCFIQGDENPYDFGAMRANCGAWHQFHSDDDPFIPLHEAERIRDGLGLTDAADDADDSTGVAGGAAAGGTYRMLPGRSHFFDYPFPELLDLLTALAKPQPAGPAE
jgi:hypothetical protein